MANAHLDAPDRLRQLLLEVTAASGDGFAGTGVIVAAVPENLPIAPLRPSRALVSATTLERTLTNMSESGNEFHDGFHVLSADFRLIRPSQYFSPPIVEGLTVDPYRRLGGRYMAALFGSCLGGVIATGVASTVYGVAVFRRGREIEPRP